MITSDNVLIVVGIICYVLAGLMAGYNAHGKFIPDGAHGWQVPVWIIFAGILGAPLFLLGTFFFLLRLLLKFINKLVG